MRFQAMSTVLAAAAAGLALAACSTASSGNTGGPSSPASSASPGAHASAPVEPDTAAAVRADADDYLTLYTAGEFAIIYQMLSAPARQAINEQAWVAVHRGCPGRDRRAVLPDPPRRSDREDRGGHGGPDGRGREAGERDRGPCLRRGPLGILPRDLGLYRHGSVPADVAAAKAAGGCAS